ncbi:signal peptide peptidase-like [Musa troglodytarum]|uniref:Signal peptide peptidase-like n=1 Tax=Musa troglodytarum TaxID=320322 RepID=A0A9E7EQ82_9LILI|nr:signal peptide peptidase-like [Musa troglodytarum]
MAIPRASSSPLLHVVLIFLSLLCFASPYSGVLAADDASQGSESASASPSCNLTSQDLSDSIVVVKRGDCTYATKARIAESSGAADLPEMVCSKNETLLNITIPVVMIPKSAGENITASLSSGGKDSHLHYLDKALI